MLSMNLFSSEERDRRARERARKAEAPRRRMMGGYDSDDETDERPPPGPPRFSPVQIALGSVGFLSAIVALILKTVDQDTLHDILSKVGLGHLVPKRDPRSVKDLCIDPKRQVTFLLL